MAACSTSADDVRPFSELPRIRIGFGDGERMLYTVACHTAARYTTSWSDCRLCDPLLLREIGGNDHADGARDITNPIMNSLSFGLDTLFLFISWYSSLVCVHFVFITVAHVKAQRGSMNIC